MTTCLISHLSPAATPTYAHYNTLHHADAQALAFDRNTGTLLVEATSPLAATQMNNYFAMTIKRSIANTGASIQGVPIAAVEFIPRAQQTWNGA
jgi:hypothetical protein